MNKDLAILSFYSFINITELEILLPKLLLLGKKKYLKGTILIAAEGFNGTISGRLEHCQFLLDELVKLTNANEIESKVNFTSSHPFAKFKVKIKKEIISMRAGEIDISRLKGTYIEPLDWDSFIARDDVIVIDTRNDYEVEEGSFKGALNPKTTSFKEFPNWAKANRDKFENKPVAMFCTGGVRCEKSTAYLKLLGYKNVYHLKGGILKYLEDTKNLGNLWQGECFVFDDRRLVDDDLNPNQQLINV